MKRKKCYNRILIDIKNNKRDLILSMKNRIRTILVGQRVKTEKIFYQKAKKEMS